MAGIGIAVFSVMVASLLSSFSGTNPGMINALAGPPVVLLIMINVGVWGYTQGVMARVLAERPSDTGKLLQELLD